MKLIRVFSRKNNATPDDENVRFLRPGIFDEADKVFVSVTFKEDKKRAEYLATCWERLTKKVTVGGPAYDDPGGEFEPGMFLKKGYVITSRGCPNHCWFCEAWKREGNKSRELQIRQGFNILDSNLLACSEKHIKAVFKMLESQKEKPRFTGGLEAAKMKPWIVEALKKLKPTTAYFAYDELSDYEPLVECCKMLKQYEILPNPGHNYFCYVLCGYKADTFDLAEKRLNQVIDLGLFPMAMLFDKENHRRKNDGWLKFQKVWADHHSVGKKIKLKNS
jgi:hypothetical protein